MGPPAARLAWLICVLIYQSMYEAARHEGVAPPSGEALAARACAYIYAHAQSDTSSAEDLAAGWRVAAGVQSRSAAARARLRLVPSCRGGGELKDVARQQHACGGEGGGRGITKDQRITREGGFARERAASEGRERQGKAAGGDAPRHRQTYPAAHKNEQARSSPPLCTGTAAGGHIIHLIARSHEGASGAAPRSKPQGP